jgi:hypothetical protein
MTMTALRDRRRFIVKQQPSGPGQSVIVWDTFTDANGVLLSAHAPERSPAAWQTVNGNLTINGNRCTGATGLSVIYIGRADFSLAASVRGVSGSASLIARYGDSLNYWKLIARFSINAIELWEQTASIWTLRGSASVGINDGADHTLRATFNGQAIRFWVDAVAPLAYTSPSHQNNTGVGISSDAVANAIDHFKVSSL